MPPSYRLRSLIVGAAAAAALLLLALTGLSAFEVERYDSNLAWVEHTHVVLDQLAQAHLQLKIAELARQDFLSTGGQAPRDGVRRAAESVRWAAEAVQKLTADNPAQEARSEELATASAEVRSSVETRAHHGSPAEGSPAIKRAENLVQSMEADERALLAERNRGERRSAAFVLAALAAEVLFAGLFAALMLGVILRDLDERERLLRDLRRAPTPAPNPASVSTIDQDSTGSGSTAPP